MHKKTIPNQSSMQFKMQRGKASKEEAVLTGAFGAPQGDREELEGSPPHQGLSV
jgi:hypothetical protein